MSTPNIVGGFPIIHAMGAVDGLTGNLLRGVNVVGVTRAALGSYQISLGTPLDLLSSMMIGSIVENVIGAGVFTPFGDQLVPSLNDDDNRACSTQNFAGGNADRDFWFIVYRLPIG